MKVEQEVPSEFLLVLDDGEDDIFKSEDDEEDDHKPKRRRAKGAYYKNIERKMLLKKKRTNVRVIISLFFKYICTVLTQFVSSRTRRSMRNGMLSKLRTYR